jgi:hypothetical protein
VILDEAEALLDPVSDIEGFMSQTSRFTRVRQLTSTVLPGRRPDGYADQVTGRLRRIAAARHGNAPVLRPQRRIHLLQGRQSRLRGIDPDTRPGPP